MRKFRFLFVCAMLLLVAPAWATHNVTTLQKLEQDVKNNLAVSADPYFPDSTLDDLINLACRDVASYGVILKVDSVLVTAGTAVYSLNDDFMEALAVFPCTSSASRGLDRIDFKDWGKIAASTQLTQSRYYSTQNEYVSDSSGGIISNAQIWLYPAHSGVADTLIVIYSAEANELLGDADTSNIPYMYRELVVFYATGLSFSRAQEYDRAAWWLSLYDQKLKQKLLYKQYGFDYIIKPKEIQK